MYAVVLTTTAAPRQALRSYKIEFDTSAELDKWLELKFFAEEKWRLWGLRDTDRPLEDCNTVVAVFRSNKAVEVRPLKCRWDQVVLILTEAEELPKEPRAGSGRHSARALVYSTSKERRTGNGSRSW